MNYLIEHQYNEYQFLEQTPRKKSIKYKLLQIKQGFALLRLGKHEFILPKDSAIWVPLNCLHSLTFLPNCSVFSIDISVRSQRQFSMEAGLVTLSPIASAITDKLIDLPFEDNNRELQALFKVFLNELSNIVPKLPSENYALPLRKSEELGINNDMLQSINLAMTVRNAFKMQLSGVKKPNIVNKLFQDNEALCDTLCMAIANKGL